MVRLNGPKGSCTGVQINAPSGKQYILSAGHCAPIAVNGSIMASVDGMRPIARKIIEEDRTSDLLLLEPLPYLKGVNLASSTRVGEHLRAYTHGARFATYEATGRIIDHRKIGVVDHIMTTDGEESKCTENGEKYSVAEVGFLFLTIKACMLNIDSYATTLHPIVPGSSGGGVVNDYGDLVAIVSAGDGTFSYLTGLEDITKFLQSY